MFCVVVEEGAIDLVENHVFPASYTENNEIPGRVIYAEVNMNEIVYVLVVFVILSEMTRTFFVEGDFWILTGNVKRRTLSEMNESDYDDDACLENWTWI